jgi:hypothetical protein
MSHLAVGVYPLTTVTLSPGPDTHIPCLRGSADRTPVRQHPGR